MSRTAKEARVQRSISVPESVYRAIEDLAHERRISVNECIVQALEAARSDRRRKDPTEERGGLSRSA
jgi:hypothetical protein